MAHRKRNLGTAGPDPLGPNPQGPGFRLVPASVIAEMLGVSESWVRDHSGTRHANRIQGPRVPCVRLGGLIRYDPNRVIEWLEVQAQPERFGIK